MPTLGGSRRQDHLKFGILHGRLILAFCFATSLMGVTFLSEHNGYSTIGLATSVPGTVVSGTYVITLKNSVNLESFADFLEKSGLLVTQKFPLNSVSMLTIVIPENMTIADLEQIFDRLKVNTPYNGSEATPPTNSSEVCSLIKKHCDIQNCEPQVEGGPAGPGILGG